MVSRAQRKTGCPACSRRERSYQTRLTRAELRFRDVAPELLTRAVRILDVDKARDIELLDLARGSTIRALWRCPDCAHEWVAPVVTRTSGRGCQPCGIRRRTASRQEPSPGGSLGDLHPEIASTFLANLDHPDRGPDRLRPGSGDRCRWHCPCCGSKEWETTVASRIQRQGCRGCRRLWVQVVSIRRGVRSDACEGKEPVHLGHWQCGCCGGCVRYPFVWISEQGASHVDWQVWVFGDGAADRTLGVGGQTFGQVDG
ncbi:zinc-ribbon domain-containing protein [Micromonospora sp. MMS20-R1-14]|uniref:Zinc-ribbon domain-containing protein n=1 Tax=Micromonospora humida TaxID=2809018 RepID=A0ABS2IUS4_9ACTN|nr:zinc-ribbon domain-containing protein [Micromonospora humida]